MRAGIKINDPGSIEATITLTMTVDQWRAIRRALGVQPRTFPISILQQAVDNLTKGVETSLNYTDEEDETEGDD